MIPAGIDVSRLKPGENRRPCPACDRGPRDTAMSVRLESDGVVVWRCHRCNSAGSTRRADHAKTPPQARNPAPRRAERPRGLSAYALALWKDTAPISGAAADYLKARACVIPPEDGDLRCMPALKHPSGYVGPAMIGLITDVCSGEPLSLHRTWVRPDGSKAEVTPPRLLLKDHPIANGVIRLWPDEAVTGGLGLSEGIETALSLAHGFTPVWSCIDAGHLAKFPVLNGIEEIIIAADNDEAGRGAADECARRWSPHATVRLVLPDAVGSDLNDEAQAWAT